MTEIIASETTSSVCPSWCVNDAQDAGPHAHVSKDVQVETLGQPLTARLVQVAGGSELRVLLNDRVATVAQAQTFAAALTSLVADARLAEPGLGFIETLAGNASASLEAMSLASGISVSALRAQSDGGQVLTVHEFDRLALAVAGLWVTSSDDETSSTPETPV